MIFSIQQDCQKTTPFGTGVFVKCDQRQKINIFEHVSNICLAKKKVTQMFPKMLDIIFQRVSNIKFCQGSMPWTPLEGHVPMQHAMLVTCMQAQFSLQFRCLFRAS